MHHNFEHQEYAYFSSDVCRTTDMATDVTEQQTVGLKRANVFSVALDESIDINDNPR